MSSFITAITHDRTSNTLTVGMRSGPTYTYVEVPRKVYRKFMDAESKGKFFNSNVRGTFKGV